MRNPGTPKPLKPTVLPLPTHTIHQFITAAHQQAHCNAVYRLHLPHLVLIIILFATEIVVYLVIAGCRRLYCGCYSGLLQTVLATLCNARFVDSVTFLTFQKF
jgi:hypothetical protein